MLLFSLLLFLLQDETAYEVQILCLEILLL